MTLFITGLNSFIGSKLSNELKKRKIKFTGIDLNTKIGSEAKKADIRDSSFADNIPENSTVVHLAAISSNQKCKSDKKLAFDVNVNGTLNVYKASKRKKCKQFVFASTEWVYGDTKEDKIFKEESFIDPLNLDSPYAKTKFLAEKSLEENEDLPITILRFGIIYGPRANNWSAVESLFDTVKNKKKIEVGSLKTARRFVHIDDIIQAIIQSFGREGREIFNITSKKLISLKDIIQCSCSILNKEIEIIETNPESPSIRNADNSKAHDQLGWKPKFNILNGLRDLHTNLYKK